jgi:hypothetical protein
LAQAWEAGYSKEAGMKEWKMDDIIAGKSARETNFLAISLYE